MQQQLEQLRRSLDDCLIQDRHGFRSALRRLDRDLKRGKNVQRPVHSLAGRMRASADKVARRAAARPGIAYPAGLPVSARAEEIKRAIAAHQVVIIAGETGSGKTTQIPKMCLELGRGTAGLIGHTQPRRLAARSVAARIAEELGVEPGKEVGYQVRFTDSTSELTFIKLMTDGILLAEIQRDPWLNGYDTIIIDEAHERSLNIDFLLGYIKRLLPRRPDLKLIVTSATIDVEKFSRHFDQAPVIEVSGRTWPVDILYRPPFEEGDDADVATAVTAAVEEVGQLQKERRLAHQDILVFLSGEKEIRDVAAELRKRDYPRTEILPLYARLSNKEQNRVFQSHPGRRIVLATNVAETSLTVPGIGYVIDSGKARISRYSVRSKVQRLPIEAVSQASASQRAGRCGRLGPGTCIRLYSEEDFNNRPAFTDTEITRTNLASVILQMLALKLGDINDFPFVDRPEPRAVNDGFKLLQELGAVDGEGTLTDSGRLMARIPVDPRFARMILEADRRHSLREVLIIASALSIQDPRERPLDKQQAADEKHRRFRDENSDLLAFVKLWDFYEVQRQSLSQNQLRKFCQQNFLSFMRMREWRELHRQLHLLCRELKLRENPTPASYDQVHLALLSGLLGQVARRLEEGDYLGARNRKFQIFPGSTLYKKKAKWILSAELVETSQLFARMNARITPEQVEQLAGPLLSREYFEPHWSKRRGRVMAWEKVSLYGLVLVEKRRVPYGSIDPEASRIIFIREALVGRQFDGNARFYRHNLELIDKIEKIEDKTRRRDILVDDEKLFAFYDARLPAEVIDAAALERWRRRAEKDDPKVLYLREEDLVARQDFDLSQFPDRIDTHAMSLDLGYAFSPGEARDGVSVQVPLSALRQLKEEDLDWLVPGMLREKCIALVKALPKPLRKHFVPVPDTVDRVLPQLRQRGQQGGNLRLALAGELRRLTGIEIPLQAWDDYRLDEHLRMNIDVVDETGAVVESGRDLAGLREGLAEEVEESLERHSRSSLEQDGLRDWSFGELPEVFEVEHGGIRIKTWPALVDEGDSVALRLLDNEARARRSTQAGVVRLLMLASVQQVRYLKKNLLRNPRRMLVLGALGGREPLLEQIIRSGCLAAFGLEESLPRDRRSYEECLARGRADFIPAAERVERLLHAIVTARQEVALALAGCKGEDWRALREDVERQLQALLHEGFLIDTPWQWLQEFPRYLNAIGARLEKFPRQAERDREWTRELDGLWRRYETRREYCERQDIIDPALEHFRWMLEEYRVSLFAQHLGTRHPVSAKRLERLWLKTAQ